MIDLNAARDYMQSHDIDGWLMYDFRANNPVLWQVLGGTQSTSRRNFVWVPARDEAVCLIHVIDRLLFEGAPFPKREYLTWQEMHEALQDLLAGCERVAMEYSPNGALPMHAFVDAGTVELIQSFGLEVVSSADLFQVAAARWSKKSVDLHRKACIEVLAVKDAAFDYIREHLGREDLNEYEVQQFIRGEFDRRGLVTDHGPIVGVNSHAGDPHYEPDAENFAPIRGGDWILIDLWAKYPDPEAVYCDITLTGFAGSDVPDRFRKIFDLVTGARDRAIEVLKDAWVEGTVLQGWQVDDACRKHISDAGYGEYFRHRTGHSMGPAPSPHALGANIDNLETHDTRRLIAGVGFSIEPGIYLPDFGVRSEVDVYIDEVEGPTVTTELQTEPILVG
ncbi:MAG: Xaa-Pro peptidase family protein [Rhodothermales bacterium]